MMCEACGCKCDGECSNEVDDLKEESRDLRRQLEYLQEKIAQYERDIDELDRENIALEERVDELEDKSSAESDDAEELQLWRSYQKILRDDLYSDKWQRTQDRQLALDRAERKMRENMAKRP